MVTDYKEIADKMCCVQGL